MEDIVLRTYAADDRAAVAALWTRCGLTRPWNDPAADIALCIDSGHGTILVAELSGDIAGTVMTGHDGHRGWAYYLAVDPPRRGRRIARRLMAAAEAWLRQRQVPKIELLIRAENDAVRSFYRHLGYADSGVRVMERWLKANPAAPGAIRRVEAIVTYLEAFGPGPRLASHPAGRMALLRVPQPSPRFYRYLYEGVGEPWFWYERRAMDDAALKAAITAPGIEISVLYADGEPAGFVEMDYGDPKDVKIAYFGLMPAAIGRGFGTYLLSAATGEAWRRSPKRVWVHTCTLDHPRALRLYQRQGFVPYKQESAVIDDPRDLGLIPASVPLPPGGRLVDAADARSGTG